LDALLPAGGGADLEQLIARLRAEFGGHDPINAMLAAELSLGLRGDMLVKVDRMSMANSLEVRCPFLDPRVVAVGAGMPGGYKLQRGSGKAILRRAFAGRVPDRVFTRPKKGFELPVDQWLRGGLAELVRAATDPARLRQQGIFSPTEPARWRAELESGRRDTAWKLWTMIAFQKWASLHGRPEAIL
jgi:asparagine synthase (glutamine-hydrolysing)